MGLRLGMGFAGSINECIMAIRTFPVGPSFRKVQSFGYFCHMSRDSQPVFKVESIPFVGKSMEPRWASLLFCSKYVIMWVQTPTVVPVGYIAPSCREWGSYPILPGDHQQASILRDADDALSFAIIMKYSEVRWVATHRE